MSKKKPDEYQETIEAIFRENTGPIDSDLIFILATNFLLCSNPENLIFYLRDKRPPEDVISLYTYLTTIELSRMMFFEQKTYSADYADFRIKTIIGLLALSPVIQEIGRKNIDETEVDNALERIEFYRKAELELSEQEFRIYIQQAISSNPNLLSLRTYFMVSLLAFQNLAQMKREEYRFLRDMQQKILYWRTGFVNQS